MITQRLKDLIKLKSLTQKKVANDLDLSVQRFNFYVNGKREPDFVTICRLADYFGVTTDYLLGRTDEMIIVKEDASAYKKSNPHLVQLVNEASSLKDEDLLKTIEYVQLLKLR